MTTPLPPFSGDRPTCAKCGGHKARTTWMPEQRLCSCRTATGIGERLCRECLRCGYHWDEAVGDPGEAATGPLDHRAVAEACRRLYNRWYWAWGCHGDAETPTGQRLLYELNMALIAEEPDSEDPGKGVPLYEFTWGTRIEDGRCQVRVLHTPTGLSHVEEGDAAEDRELLYRAFGCLAGTVRVARRA